MSLVLKKIINLKSLSKEWIESKSHVIIVLNDLITIKCKE